MNQMPLDLYKGHTSCMKRHETKSGLATESGKAFSLWDGGLLQLTPDPTQSIRPSASLSLQKQPRRSGALAIQQVFMGWGEGWMRPLCEAPAWLSFSWEKHQPASKVKTASNAAVLRCCLVL
ncbi:uncharacterized protein LOC126050152 isoform X3 [Accipiter gentilis]|uniref:uncharacterized protein LOC126050152 isoform X3 n=1 Tax=Astur gentilis TaxID=8957 RepID=UPI00210F248A|nr:uncharacterized protein LOC126050152 isoform X3 [Accipiter gentilis]